MERNELCACHRGIHRSDTRRKAIIKLCLAGGLGILFMTGQFIGGYIANSLAIMTDAAHMFTDVMNFGISLLAIWLGKKQSSNSMTFGWQRAEVLGALVSVLVIFVITTAIIHESWVRILRPDSFEVNPEVMLITACIGVVMNVFMCIILHNGHSHTHHHSHTHSHANELLEGDKAEKPKTSMRTRTASTSSINVKAAMIHVIGDLLQSIGLLVAVAIIWFRRDWEIADPICSVVFGALMFLTAITVLKDVLRILLEAVPQGISFEQVREDLTNVEGVKQVHSLYIWSITTGKTVLAAHLAIEAEATSNEVLITASTMLREVHGVSITTLQVEAYNQLMENCQVCVDETNRARTVKSTLSRMMGKIRRRRTLSAAEYQLVPQENTEL